MSSILSFNVLKYWCFFWIFLSGNARKWAHQTITGPDNRLLSHVGPSHNLHQYWNVHYNSKTQQTGTILAYNIFVFLYSNNALELGNMFESRACTDDEDTLLHFSCDYMIFIVHESKLFHWFTHIIQICITITKWLWCNTEGYR